jgi:hypothetical protein
MERENFYLLLELSVDPPEEDPEKIESAIKKQQAQWSRFRNHPTKALMAKQYISLLPEIRKVMADAGLRRKEAESAKKKMAANEGEKFSEIDRHIDIRMSKGYISEKEIVKLAGMHAIDKDDIRKRIQLKRQQKLSEIDKTLKHRAAKGYITEKEIISLSKEYAVKPEDIRKMATCPIKDDISILSSKARLLDKAIEKIIKDNLKIVGNSSLYEFLGLPADAILEGLQEATEKKEGQLQKISKKDAFVTASSILIGHCMTIFKTEETRQSYDMSLTGSYLSELDSNIDIAGMDGMIRSEYFDMLVKTAEELGMDTDDAVKYIREYCRKKKLTIQTVKKKSFLNRFGMVIGAVIVIVFGVTVFIYFNNKWDIKNEYKKVVLTVNNEQDLKKKEQLLQAFLNTHTKSPFTDDAIKKMEDIQNIINEKEYKSYVENINKLMAEENYNEAVNICEQFLKRYPQSLYSEQVKQKIKLLLDLIEETHFKALDAVASLDVTERLAAYTAYLKKHPEGRYVNNVMDLVEKMSEEYYIFVERSISVYEKQEDWANAVQLCNNFIDIYGHGKRSEEFKIQRDKFRNILWENETFARLMKKAEEMGNNFKEAKQLYSDFLGAYPNAHIKGKVENELARLEKMEKTAILDEQKSHMRRLIKDSGGRFVENKEGAVKDNHTGLIWCLIDSTTDTGLCMDYESAVSYVKHLKTGGYTDWRLPSSDEIAKIYKVKPFFPQGETQWYWTSKSYPRYASGWSKVVDTVTSKNESQWENVQKDSRDCGSVRAVRP